MKSRERLLTITTLINFLGLKMIEDLERNKLIAKEINHPEREEAEENVLWLRRSIKEYEERLMLVINKLENIGINDEYLTEKDIEFITPLIKGLKNK